MRSVICVHESFDAHWPFVADYWHKRWEERGECELYRTEKADVLASELVIKPESVTRLVLLGFPANDHDLEFFSSLEECFHMPHKYSNSGSNFEAAQARGVIFIPHRVDVYWGQSVAEFALGLTISALRRIPQTYKAMMTSHDCWKYVPTLGKPGERGAQYGDDGNFTSGTLAGKRVRIIGAGNIGARYASFCSTIGADVAIWDPFAPDAAFAVSGARRCFHITELVKDSEIFVPMVPHTESTTGLVTADLINALPIGGLVVQVTRAKVCDTEALYRRVLNDELSLAADVFVEEPLDLDSPLMGRHNVIHTPHNGGRTLDANHRFAEDQMSRFRPRQT